MTELFFRLIFFSSPEGLEQITQVRRPSGRCTRSRCLSFSFGRRWAGCAALGVTRTARATTDSGVATAEGTCEACDRPSISAELLGRHSSHGLLGRLLASW